MHRREDRTPLGPLQSLGRERPGAWCSLLMGITFQQGKKIADGNQLFLSNLTFETSSNFICKVMAPSVPGLEQSKQVAVAVQGKNWHRRGHGALPERAPSQPALPCLPLTSPPHREAADRGRQLPAVRAAGRGGEPDLQGHCSPQALSALERQRDGESC